MIKLTNVNKFYSKGSSNQLHVVNNTTLELPDTGFVTILGASGSGKTTLLNIIGGLDRFDNGSIEYDDLKVDRYSMNKIDEFRERNIGYVFQNYLLLEENTVFDNLKQALEIMGIYDPIEQKKRIEYTLKWVGLYKFRKKRVKNLSGGQMQRVSIARALLKNAKIIIADEPTGNIDSENTIEVMNILKKISKITLVLLVTHENNIADYYSDRIIRIKDGQIISDEIVTEKGTLDRQTNRKIYLKDLNNEVLNNDKYRFNVYSDNENNNVDINIVIKNDTIYIQTNKNVINVNESSIEILDQSYEEAKITTEDNTDFDTSWYNDDQKKKKPSLGIVLKEAMNSFFKGKKSNILFGIIFLILGIIMGISMNNLMKLTNVDLDVLNDNDELYVVYGENSTLELNCPYTNGDILKDAFKKGLVTNVYSGNNLNYALRWNYNYIRGKNISGQVSMNLYKDSQKLIIGNAPVGNECVIGVNLADDLIEKFGYNSGDYDKLLGLNLRNEYSYKEDGYIISGIATNKNKLVYVTEVGMELDRIYFNTNNENEYFTGLNTEMNYSIVEGSDIANDDEVIVNNELLGFLNVNIGDNLTLGTKDYKVVGTYSINTGSKRYIVLTKDRSILGLIYNNYSGFEFGLYSFTYCYLSDQNYTLVEGKTPVSETEILVNVNSMYKIGDELDYGRHKVVGIYRFNNDLGSDFIDNAPFVIISSLEEKISEIGNRFFSVSDYDAAKTFFEEKGYTIEKVTKYQIERRLDENFRGQITAVVTFGILLFIVIIYSYFSSRSRMIHDIYSIGVYRSLGKAKKSIGNQYIAFSFIQTSFTSVLGFLISTGVSIYMTLSFPLIFGKLNVLSFVYIILGIILLYLINMIASIIPISALLRKTPAEINSKYDI